MIFTRRSDFSGCFVAVGIVCGFDCGRLLRAGAALRGTKALSARNLEKYE